MNAASTREIVLLALLFPVAPLSHGEPLETCPVSAGEHVYADAAFPLSHWYGTRSLAVTLPSTGAVFGITQPSAEIAARLFWWSEDFVVGTSTQLEVTVERFDGARSTARVVGPTDSVHTHKDDGSPPFAMAIGLDFPDPGCWRITGRYGQHEVTFVVESRSSK